MFDTQSSLLSSAVSTIPALAMVNSNRFKSLQDNLAYAGIFYIGNYTSSILSRMKGNEPARYAFQGVHNMIAGMFLAPEHRFKMLMVGANSIASPALFTLSQELIADEPEDIPSVGELVVTGGTLAVIGGSYLMKYNMMDVMKFVIPSHVAFSVITSMVDSGKIPIPELMQ